MTLTELKPGRWQAAGELTFATCTDSWPALLASLQGSALQVDLAGLRRIDSAGLATLVAWLSEAHRRAVSVKLVAATEQVLQLARVAGVDSLLPLQWDSDAAVNA